MRPRPLSTRTYLKEASEVVRIAWDPASQRIAWNPNVLGMVFSLAGLLSFIALLLFGLPLLAPQFGRELIDSTTHRYTLTVGQWYDQILPDGKQTRVRVRYMGRLAPGQVLKHADLGDEYFYKGNYWIWMIPAGKAVPEWVDP